MQRISDWYGRILDGMLAIACALLLVMTFLTGFDVLLRNVGAGGVPPSNELSEYGLYLTTILAAPSLLRRGQHIRVDILLRVIPPRLAWCFEWIGDIIGAVCCVYFVWYGARVTLASYAAGAVSIKTSRPAGMVDLRADACVLPDAGDRVHLPHEIAGAGGAGAARRRRVGVVTAVIRR